MSTISRRWQSSRLSQRRSTTTWTDRALSEITTEGYQPNHKHGVEINITPLAQSEIVPKTVEDDVL
jgi:hypothetical protein